jgi:hypothetical protein
MTDKQITNQLQSIASADDFVTSSAELTEAWSTAGIGAECIGPVLQFMEEHPALEYGMPGPLVHFVEEYYRKGYEVRLIESVSRKPTMLTVWMLNRVINDTQEPKERQQLISTMRQAANNPKADHRTLDRINGFLDRLKSEL